MTVTVLFTIRNVVKCFIPSVPKELNDKCIIDRLWFEQSALDNNLIPISFI